MNIPKMRLVTGLPRYVLEDIKNGKLYVNRKGLIAANIPNDAYCPMTIWENATEPSLMERVAGAYFNAVNLEECKEKIIPRIRRFGFIPKFLNIFANPDFWNVYRYPKIECHVWGTNGSRCKGFDDWGINRIQKTTAREEWLFGYLPSEVINARAFSQSIINNKRFDDAIYIDLSGKKRTKKYIEHLSDEVIDWIKVTAARNEYGLDIVDDVTINERLSKIREKLLQYYKFQRGYKKSGVKSKRCEKLMSNAERVLLREYYQYSIQDRPQTVRKVFE